MPDRIMRSYTGRPVILYASDFTNPIKANNAKVQMDLDDKLAFKDVIEVLVGDAVDVLDPPRRAL